MAKRPQIVIKVGTEMLRPLIYANIDLINFVGRIKSGKRVTSEEAAFVLEEYYDRLDDLAFDGDAPSSLVDRFIKNLGIGS